MRAVSLISALAAGLGCVHAGYLIDEQGRCLRHPEESKSWCLECACIASVSAALRDEVPRLSKPSSKAYLDALPRDHE